MFRKFCHLELGGDVPEASTLGRFRDQLVEHDLWERLLGEINRQLDAKNIILTEWRINSNRCFICQSSTGVTV
ncbi:MAG: transposase [Paracoccaceae bacterium]